MRFSEGSRPHQPFLSPNVSSHPRLPHPTTVSSQGQQASQGDQADPAGLWGNVPGRGTSWVPSEGGMVKPDSQMGEFAP